MPGVVRQWRGAAGCAALSPAALEANRLPGDDAPPWLSFQAVIESPDDWLAGYPRPELLAVRKAFAEAKAAYLGRDAADRPAKFSAAMDRFAENLCDLSEKVEPERQSLPLLYRDQETLDATAYPPPGATDMEVFYNRLDPFFWSWVLGLAATLCLLLAVGRLQKPAFWLGTSILIVAQLFTAFGLWLRMDITGLIPLTGMFETVVFVSLCVAVIGLGLALLPLTTLVPTLRVGTDLPPALVPTLCVGTDSLRRSASPGSTQSVSEPAFPRRASEREISAQVMQRRLFVLSGAIVSFVAAALAYYAPASVMHRALGSVVPILRDNTWLAVHVVTIMVSYATAAIAIILGDISLGYYLFGRYRKRNEGDIDQAENTVAGRCPPADCSVLAGFIYTVIQITVVLLAAGTVLAHSGPIRRGDDFGRGIPRRFGRSFRCWSTC